MIFVVFIFYTFSAPGGGGRKAQREDGIQKQKNHRQAAKLHFKSECMEDTLVF
jgi:hypothetical protein